jgi:hypothetical protein
MTISGRKREVQYMTFFYTPALLKTFHLHEQHTVTLHQVWYLSTTVAVFTELFKLLKLGNFVEVSF